MSDMISERMFSIRSFTSFKVRVVLEFGLNFLLEGVVFLGGVAFMTNQENSDIM